MNKKFLRLTQIGVILILISSVVNGLFLHFNRLDEVLFLDTYMDFEAESGLSRYMYYVTNKNDDRRVYGIELEEHVHLEVLHQHEIELPFYKVVVLDITPRNYKSDEITTYNEMKLLFNNNDRLVVNNSIIRLFPTRDYDHFSWRSGGSSNTGESYVVYSVKEKTTIEAFNIPQEVEDLVQVKFGERVDNYTSVDEIILPLEVDYSFKVSTMIEKNTKVIGVFFEVKTDKGDAYLLDISSSPSLEYEDIKAFVKENR